MLLVCVSLLVTLLVLFGDRNVSEQCPPAQAFLYSSLDVHGPPRVLVLHQLASPHGQISISLSGLPNPYANNLCSCRAPGPFTPK